MKRRVGWRIVDTRLKLVLRETTNPSAKMSGLTVCLVLLSMVPGKLRDGSEMPINRRRAGETFNTLSSNHALHHRRRLLRDVLHPEKAIIRNPEYQGNVDRNASREFNRTNEKIKFDKDQFLRFYMSEGRLAFAER